MCNFIDLHFPIPTFVEWEPDQWSKEHYYKDLTDKRTYKRYLKDKEKENQKRKDNINNIVKKKSEILRMIDGIDQLPSDISDLFYTTMKYQVEDGIRIRALYTTIRQQFYQKYNEDIVQESFKYKSTPCTYAKEIVKMIKYDYDYTQQKQVIKYDQDKFNYISNRCPYIQSMDLEQFYLEATKYFEIQKEASSSLLPPDCLYHGSRKCFDICNEIKHIFNGNPERCVKDPNWGVGGYFNGVLEGNGIKVSFKSFVAGGYNIQKRHIRFRMTKLKN